MNEWRDIATAPTNESVLIFVPNMEHYGHGIYRALHVDMGTRRHWQVTAIGMGRNLAPMGLHPTHWMPLPDPPSDPTVTKQEAKP
jgi:hypothetical protein